MLCISGLSWDWLGAWAKLGQVTKPTKVAWVGPTFGRVLSVKELVPALEQLGRPGGSSGEYITLLNLAILQGC